MSEKIVLVTGTVLIVLAGLWVNGALGWVLKW
jgi:hypothetical protein